MKKGISNLRYRIEILSPVSSFGAYNQEIVTWEHVCFAMADVTFPTTGQTETFNADQQVAITRANFRIHRRDGLSEKHCVKLDGIFWDIKNIVPAEGFREYLFLSCEKRV